MTHHDLYEFLASRQLAVLATVGEAGEPQATLIGIAVNEALEVVFDTLDTTRKYRNILRNPSVALVAGWDSAITLQYEGVASLLSGEELPRYKQVYFRRWPDGPERESWPGICYFKIRPRWIRYSDFTPGHRSEEHFRFA